jgi:hypothetical protein
MALASVRFPVDLPLEEVRAVAHEAIDKWVDGLAPLFEQQTPAQLTDLSDHFQKSRQELLGACMKALVEKLYAGYLDQRWAECPRCGTGLGRKRMDPKEISTLQSLPRT